MMPQHDETIRKREPGMVPTDTPEGVTRGGGGATGPKPELQKRVVSGDRETGEPAHKRPAGEK